MLWTVFTDLPIEERLAKIAEAGYSNVELVGEYRNWSEPTSPAQTLRESGSAFSLTPPPG
jgi:sugar phosphate isomerase/epimerase